MFHIVLFSKNGKLASTMPFRAVDRVDGWLLVCQSCIFFDFPTFSGSKLIAKKSEITKMGEKNTSNGNNRITEQSIQQPQTLSIQNLTSSFHKPDSEESP